VGFWNWNWGLSFSNEPEQGFQFFHVTKTRIILNFFLNGLEPGNKPEVNWKLTAGFGWVTQNQVKFLEPGGDFL
jgi:hypothetical protein